MKRRGFTLIELMVVIAIIIILAAIAIPNYLNMTRRAKVSRVQSDMATLATALETFRTDWGKYPTATEAEPVNDSSKNIYKELSGAGGGTINQSGKYNAVGEAGPIEYIKGTTLTSIVNPFDSTKSVNYGSQNGTHWVLYCDMVDGSGKPFMSRTDGASTPTYTASAPAIP